jgi:surface antigen
LRIRRKALGLFLAPALLLAGMVSIILLLPASVEAARLQCVQYARIAANVPLKGDAWTWWDKARRAKFARGHVPEIGAVVVFRKTENLRRGHVAVVAAVVSDREVLIDHANWASRRAERGQVETGVRMIDVSPNNDWSQVRVWHGPSATFGKRVYPTYGFIYPSTES